MDMMEVDVQLFIKCRLCVKEMGLYQILPAVQQQIKYCFDIDVHPFDGLPQLICKKCEGILFEYNSIKKRFQETQQELKNKLEERRQNAARGPVEIHKDDSVDMTETQEKKVTLQNVENDDTSDKISGSEYTKSHKKKSRIKKRIRLISSSSSSSMEDITFKNSISKSDNNKRRKRRNNSSESWEQSYNKHFVCRLCYKSCITEYNLKKHFHTHDSLIQKHQNIFNSFCKVTMHKVDAKPNITGINNNNTVAYESDMIIRYLVDTHYYMIYTLKYDYMNVNNRENTLVNKTKQTSKTFSDTSDDENFVHSKQRQSKKCRLLSRSSNETMVIGNDNESVSSVNIDKAESGDNECINIDDTSNESTSVRSEINLQKYIHLRKPVTNMKSNDYKIIKDVIKMCQYKYFKKLDSSESDVSSTTQYKQTPYSEFQLKHKILSIGRKVISKQGFPCTGLLRFLEHKNLEIKWLSTSHTNTGNNYVRIMMKLRGINNGLIRSGWKNINENRLQIKYTDEKLIINDENTENPIEETISKIKYTDKKLSINDENTENPVETISKIKYTDEKLSINDENTANPVEETISNINKIAEKECRKVYKENFDDSAKLYTCNNNDLGSRNKLLNANPVANPKQLPKKHIELKLNSVKSGPASFESYKRQFPNSKEHGSVCIDLDDNNGHDENLQMPIIASTTSLAVSESVGEVKNDVIDSSNTSMSTSSMNADKNTEKSAPRIKVKSFSELMSDRALDSLKQQQQENNVWIIPPQNAETLVYIPNFAPVWPSNIVSQPQFAPLIVPATVAQPQPVLAALTQPQVVSAAVTQPQLLPAARAVTQPTHNTNHTSLENSRDYIILNTVEFPNMKTTEPLEYFRNLLQVHGITLLNTSAELSRGFVCLIKFKLHVKQEDIQPVVLCLSLWCNKNTFCLKITDINQEEVDISKINLNWQWEVLKVYRGDIVKKLLQNAQKISREAYKFSTTFTCLLKSIQKV